MDAVRFEELLAATRGALRDGDVRGASDAIGSALALWRGSALQGLARTAWFGDEARRLEALRVDALEEQFEVALALGEHRELTPALRSALADNPFRERLWGQLMLALYRSGRQADALEAFQEATARARRRAGARAGARAAAPPGGDPRARPGDRGRPCRPQAPRQSPGALDVVRRPRGRAGPGRRPSGRAPPRDAHRAARRRQEPPGARGGALSSSTSSGRASGLSTSLARATRRTPFDSSRTPSTFAAPTRSLA